MIWCPNSKCDDALTKVGNERKLTCEKCKTEACFICQRPWHGENICQDDQVMSLYGFLCRNDVRKCPACKIRIEKNGGCPHMQCFKCKYDFGWCCMQNIRKHHKWYGLCPHLPFNLCVKILLVLLGMIFMPVIFTLGPLGFAFYLTGYAFIEMY